MEWKVVNLGNDWAIDVDGTTSLGGYHDIDLYLDYDGAGSGATLPVDNNEDITVYATVATGVLNFRNPPRDACEYRAYDVRVSYTDTSGTTHNGLIIGRIWFAHGDNWQYTTGATIGTNASRPNPSGSGTIYYISGIEVADVYGGGDTGANPKCSTGAHVHVEVLSNHNWGDQQELHSSFGPDGYHGLAGVSDHIHSGTGGGYNATGVISAGTKIGAVGGGSTAFDMD